MEFTEFLKSDLSKKPHYLLIGSPIGHSISPMMHNAALEHYNLPATYHAVGVRNSEINTLIAHFNNKSFLGANVTIPYKETLFDAVDILGIEAAQIGAINTIVKKADKIVGENTDAYGFITPIEDFRSDLEGERAIIFGTGGANKAIQFALRKLGLMEIVVVSRRPEQYEISEPDLIMCSYENWPAYAEDAAIIVNATPLGMTPNTDASPIQNSEIDLLRHKLCYDIVYNPRDTKFLKQAEIVGGIPIGGLDMLIHQGAKSFQMWTEKEFPVGLIKMRLDEVFPI